MNHHRTVARVSFWLAVAAASAAIPGLVAAQSAAPHLAAGWGDDPPVLSSLVGFARTESDLRVAVDRYLLDKAAIERRYEVPYSPVGPWTPQQAVRLDVEELAPRGRPSRLDPAVRRDANLLLVDLGEGPDVDLAALSILFALVGDPATAGREGGVENGRPITGDRRCNRGRWSASVAR